MKWQKKNWELEYVVRSVRPQEEKRRLGSLVGSNLGLHEVFRDCTLPSRLHLLSKENAAISLFRMRRITWVEGLPRAVDGATSQAVGPAAMGVTFEWWQLRPGEWDLGYLVLKEQWRVRGNRGLDFFQGFLMNAMRKMEKITFFEPVVLECRILSPCFRQAVLLGISRIQNGCYFKTVLCFVFSLPLSFINY